MSSEKEMLTAFRDKVFENAIAQLEESDSLPAVCEKGSQCQHEIYEKLKLDTETQWREFKQSTIDNIRAQETKVTITAEKAWEEMKKCGPGCEADCASVEGVYGQTLQ